MMIVPAGVKVHLALGYTDMRKGIDGLAALVEEQLKRNLLFAFRGKRASILKVCSGMETDCAVHQARRSGRLRVAAPV
jgi:hypothetical protein